MKDTGYKQFIEAHIAQAPYHRPIYTSEVALALAGRFNLPINKARALTNVNLARFVNSLDLVRQQKGVYYRTRQTPFGKTGLNPAYIQRDRYLQKNDAVIGYETGAAFMNRIGLTTQVPKYVKIATNAVRHRGNRTDKNFQVVIRKPKAPVTKENVLYLQLLDAIENKDKIQPDAPDPEKVLNEYIQQKDLDIVKLITISKNYYTHATQLKLIQTIAAE